MKDKPEKSEVRISIEKEGMRKAIDILHVPYKSKRSKQWEV